MAFSPMAATNVEWASHSNSSSCDGISISRNLHDFRRDDLDLFYGDRRKLKRSLTPARQFEIDFCKNLGVEQRAVLRTA